MNKKHYVYILKCSDGTYYTGYTTDPERRTQVHNAYLIITTISIVSFSK
ncbi:MAG: GIY-YIG nuclease family protein [Parasporobacterium sp.]|nr:GIY-YIG nuclease family protein [Parasporobacterium sp.]